MKPRHFLLVLLTCLAGLAGCGKKEQQQLPADEIGGVKVDLPALRADLEKATPEVQSAVNEIQRNLRYGLYINALEALDKISSNPALTEPQKKSVATVIEQMKQVIAKNGPRRQ
jgi:hypothetical protein